MNRNLATSLVSVVFLIVGLSGVMLYFHLFSMQAKELHENLGMAFIVAAALHILYNWGGMKKYFTNKVFIGIFAAFMLISIAMVGEHTGAVDAKSVVLEKVIDAPLENSFAVFGVEVEAGIKKLQAQGIKITSETTIGEIAKANQSNPFRIVGIIIKE